MRGLKNRKFGKDAQKLVSDVRRLTKTGRKRRSTMGSRGEKGSSSRVANTIGYRFPLNEDDDDEDAEDEEGEGEEGQDGDGSEEE